MRLPTWLALPMLAVSLCGCPTTGVTAWSEPEVVHTPPEPAFVTVAYDTAPADLYMYVQDDLSKHFEYIWSDFPVLAREKPTGRPVAEMLIQSEGKYYRRVQFNYSAWWLYANHCTQGINIWFQPNGSRKAVYAEPVQCPKRKR